MDANAVVAVIVAVVIVVVVVMVVMVVMVVILVVLVVVMEVSPLSLVTHVPIMLVGIPEAMVHMLEDITGVKKTKINITKTVCV